MLTTQQKRDVLSVAELKSQLDSLSQADWIRLERAAKTLCWGLAIESQDLLNEIFCRALEGRRKCPTNVPINIFLMGGMESIVSAYLKKRSRDVVEQAVIANNSDCEEADSFLNENWHMDTPEEILLAQQTLDKYEKLFSNNETAQMVLMGQIDGCSPHEIQEICGLNPIEYASTLRFIRRKLDKCGDEELRK